jgi:hypothetical protein
MSLTSKMKEALFMALTIYPDSPTNIGPEVATTLSIFPSHTPTIVLASIKLR